MIYPGQSGMGLQYREIVSPIAGYFGINVQKATNLLLTVKDEKDLELSGATVSYPSGTDTITFTTSAVSTLYELAIPVGVTTTITLSRPGYATQSFDVTIAANDFMTVTKTMVLNVNPFKNILRRH
jgi:hypothetical protein